MKNKLILLSLVVFQTACSGGSGGAEPTATDISNSAVVSNNTPNGSNVPSGATVSTVNSGSTSTAQVKSTIVSDVTTTTQAATKPLTDKEKIEALEKLNKLPTLDRSDSLLGPDLDNNGIRDDIDAYILSQNFEEPIKKAAHQVAKAFLKILVVDPSDPVSVKAADLVLAKSLFCIDSIYIHKNLDYGFAITDNLEKITYNTKTRVKAYLKYNASMNGKILSSPKGDTCE